MGGQARDRIMSNNLNSKTDPGEAAAYEIRIKGHLGLQWADWFGGLNITLEENGDTFLTGTVADQAALHGLLRKVRDLGMPLLSVVCVRHSEVHAPDVKRIALTEAKQLGWDP